MANQEVPAEVKMALGRLFQMMMRPSEPGDIDTFNAIYSIVMGASEPPPETWTANYARDRMRGAAGDF